MQGTTEIQKKLLKINIVQKKLLEMDMQGNNWDAGETVKNEKQKWMNGKRGKDGACGQVPLQYVQPQLVETRWVIDE